MRATAIFSKFSVIYLFLLFTSITTNAQESMPWMHFSWQSQILNGRFVEKTAMIVPLRINKIPYQFEAQFDLGAVSTMIYGKTFAPYLAQNSELREQINMEQTVMIEGNICPCFQGDIYLDKIEFPNQKIALFEDFGEEMTRDSIHTTTIKHIGTVAADMFNTQILVIDYVNQKLCSVDTLPEDWIRTIDFVDIDYIKENNWIFLPLQIGDTVRKVIFDTGSSLFPLVSSPSKIAQICDVNKSTDSVTVSSWGKEEVVYGYAPKVHVSLGETNFDRMPVYISQGLDDASLDDAGCWGIVGNQYFLNSVIIIDYKNNRFGIRRP